MTGTSFVIRYRPKDGIEETASPRQAALLPFETFLLWRQPRPYKGQQNARAYYWFSKGGGHVFCESRLEARVLQGLDFDRDVTSVAAQPFELSFDADGKRRRHVPDFFVRCLRGPDRIIDVKPVRRVDEPRNARSFRATRAMCAEVGWVYVVATEPDPVFHANVSWLAGYKRPPALFDEFAEPLLELARGGSTVEDLIDPFELPALVRPVLFHLLWRHKLSVDLSVLLSDASVVRPFDEVGAYGA